jgi:hypothetical protein
MMTCACGKQDLEDEYASNARKAYLNKVGDG